MRRLKYRSAFISLSRKNILNHQPCSRIIYLNLSGSNTRPSSVLFSTEPKSAQVTEIQKVYDELKRLSQEIRENDVLYYTPGLTPKLSDSEYDALVKREEDICKKYPELINRIGNDTGLGSNATRYGGRVGLVMPGKDNKIHHLENSPMQSLDNAITNEDVLSWLNRIRKRLLKETNYISNARALQIITEPKMDGLSLSLRYNLTNMKSRRFTLRSAATRGDGTKGEDVSEAVLDIHTVPRTFTLSDQFCKVPSIIEVRGEIILPRSKFHELKRKSEDQEFLKDSENAEAGTSTQNSFSNARNAASGILMRKKSSNDQSDEEIRNTKRLRSSLRFYAYAFAFADESGKDEFDMFDDGMQLRGLLTALGFLLPEPCDTVEITLHEEREVNEADCTDLLHFHNDIMTSRSDSNADFEVDGAVYKLSSMNHRHLLGSSSRVPRWALAHKFPAQCAVTKIDGIEVQIGRTGSLTPVAILEPVDIGGVTVTRASLHNFHLARNLLQVTENDASPSLMGKVEKGAQVIVSRAGDVIPQVIRRLKSEHAVDVSTLDLISLDIPTKCPACGSPTTFSDNSDTTKSTEMSVGQVLRCSGPQLLCQPRAVGALAHTFSRNCIDVPGLSEARLQQLSDERLIRVPADLFSILDDQSDLSLAIMNLNGWGEKSVANLRDQIQKVKQEGVSLSKFINSLGIRHVGTVSSTLIASSYGSWPNFVSSLEKAALFNDGDSIPPLPELSGVKNIGPVIIKSLVSFSKYTELLEAAKRLATCVPIHDVNFLSPDRGGIEKLLAESLPFSGKSVVFTGLLPDGMSRSVAEDVAKDILGAKSTPSSISSNTGLLVIGQKGGKKALQAKELGIPTISADEFVDLVKRYSSVN